MSRFAVLLGTVLTVSAAFAGAWSTPSGTVAPFFNYDGGSDVNGLYGDPFWSGTSLIFTPANFVAVSTNGAPPTAVVWDTVGVNLHLQPEWQVSSVLVQELGDYSITGPSGSVLAQGTIVLTNLDTAASLLAVGVYTPPMPVTAPGSNQWFSSYAVAVPAGWANFNVALTNTFTATSEAGTATSIGKALSGTTFQIAVIPEPTSALLVLVGAFALRRR
jgi:hypothetical protein